MALQVDNQVAAYVRAAYVRHLKGLPSQPHLSIVEVT